MSEAMLRWLVKTPLRLDAATLLSRAISELLRGDRLIAPNRPRLHRQYAP